MRKLVLIGASTGGPKQIKKLITSLKLQESTIIIAQHMQADFLPSFATQLDRECASRVRLIDAPMFLEDGIYVCKSNTELHVNLRAAFASGSYPFCPNVNCLFSSAAKICSQYQTMAILLTGIGDDGAAGLYELYKAGAKCIGESERSCIVYGMPKRAWEMNNKLMQLDISDIKIELEKFLRD